MTTNTKDIFNFKQFSVLQRENAQKVTTAGVLLGAWSQIQGTKILDAGAGTGLVSLMLSQRFSETEITAIELYKDSQIEMKQNFVASPFSSRLISLCGNFLDLPPKRLYDSVVSNPPFFLDSLNSPDKGKNTARHAVSSEFKKWMVKCSSLCTSEAKINVVIAPETELLCTNTLHDEGFFPEAICKVRSKSDKKIVLVLLRYSKMPVETRLEELVLNNPDGTRTASYQELTKDFYLNL